MLETIFAFSDTHGYPLPDKIIPIADESKHIFFLGDGINGLGDMLTRKNLHIVAGNCDRSEFPSEIVLEIGGMRILLTHGHRYGVKNDLLPLALRAKELHCEAAFYGHTHVADISTYDGVTLICPGSLCYPHNFVPSYAYAVVSDGKLVAKIVNLS